MFNVVLTVFIYIARYVNQRGSELQQFAADCSGLQRIAADCSGLQRIAADCSGLQRIAADCSGLQRVAAWVPDCSGPQIVS